jgi:hypothetical protein
VIVKNPPRKNVIAGNRTAYHGMRLIDDKIYSLHIEGANVWMATKLPEDLWESETSMGTLFNQIAQQVPTLYFSVPSSFSCATFLKKTGKRVLGQTLTFTVATSSTRNATPSCLWTLFCLTAFTFHPKN